MTRILINELKNHVGKEITLAGFIDVRRDHGKLIFIDVRDRSGLVQIVVSPKNEKAYAALKEARPEWVIEIKGIVHERPKNMVNPDIETGSIEVAAQDVVVLSKAIELPFEKDTELNLDIYLDHLPLTLRREKARSIFKVQAEIIRAYREALVEKGFVEFQAPKLVGDDAEGG